MHDFHPQPELFDAVLELQVTTGVSGQNDFSFCRCEVAHFPFKERHGVAKVHDVVNAGASATPARFREFNKFDSGNRLDDPARLAGYSLRVNEVAGLVIGDPACHGMPRLDAAVLGEKLRDILRTSEGRPAGESGMARGLIKGR